MAMVNQFDIVGALRDFATSKGWKFLYGYDEYINASNDIYSSGQLVLACEMFVNPILSIHGGGVESVDFNGTIMLGRKFETTTTASLDETMIQKHDRRLAELWDYLTNGMSDLACSNQWEVSLTNGTPLINFTMHNIDFVKYNISIRG